MRPNWNPAACLSSESCSSRAEGLSGKQRHASGWVEMSHAGLGLARWPDAVVVLKCVGAFRVQSLFLFYSCVCLTHEQLPCSLILTDSLWHKKMFSLRSDPELWRLLRNNTCGLKGVIFQLRKLPNCWLIIHCSMVSYYHNEAPWSEVFFIIEWLYSSLQRF